MRHGKSCHRWSFEGTITAASRIGPYRPCTRSVSISGCLQSTRMARGAAPRLPQSRAKRSSRMTLIRIPISRLSLSTASKFSNACSHSASPTGKSSNCLPTTPPNNVRASLDESRKWGIYYITNLLFKTYFKLNSASLSRTILTSLAAYNNRGDMPPLQAFPKSQRVTFKYYEGVLFFLEENYMAVCNAMDGGRAIELMTFAGGTASDRGIRPMPSGRQE